MCRITREVKLKEFGDNGAVSSGRRVLEIVLIVASYLLTLHWGTALSFAPGYLAPVWLPSGIMLAVSLIVGYRLIPGVFLGAFAGTVWSYIDPSSPSVIVRSILSGLANGLGEAVGLALSIYLMRVFGGDSECFSRVKQIVSFIAFGVILGPFVSALLGATSLGLVGFVDWSDYPETLSTWWTEDSIGVLILTPVVFVWAVRRFEGLTFSWERLTYAVLLLGVGSFLLFQEPGFFSVQLTLSVIAPVLVWAVFRFEGQTVFSSLFFVSTLSVFATVMDVGPFATQSFSSSLISLELFIAVVCVTALLMYTAVNEQKEAEVQLRVYRDSLEQQVQERTLELRNKIEELENAEEKLFESNEKFNSSFQYAGIGMALVSVEGRILESNKTLCELLGYSEKELASRSFLEITFEDDRQDDWDLFQQLVAGERDSYSIEKRYYRKDGQIIRGKLTASLVRDQRGQVRFVIGMLEDITEKRRAEEELLKMQKLKSVGTLAGGIAHDFNNILMGLFGNISLAKMKLPSGHSALRPLEEVENSMDRATRLTGQLLTFAKGGEPIRENVRLRPLVEEVVRFDLSGSKVKLVLKEAEDLWLAGVDGGQMQQVFSNLSMNARDAMEDGGHLFISFQNVVIPELNALGLAAGRYIRVVVRDEGVGIPADELSQIFDPYFSTKATGSGLGLTTVYSIVTKHGGHIGVKSKPGRGTSFTLHLPASEREEEKRENPDELQSAEQSSPLRVLVMDDDKSIRQLVRKILERYEHSVETVVSGEEAIERYRESLTSGNRFDAVIMDLTIPGGMGGEDAIKEILALDPEANCIVSSGYANDPVMARYQEYGFKGIAIKPYSIEQLLEVLRRVASDVGGDPPH